ncbi:hypothetical protein ACFZAM_32070 [Streptomyces sp. NPDC008079]|uniref:hypothetical protein n=1 Tax=Streptomyces sp. NPDC008079 TaxID=3364806 RepID=UPI0036E3DB46
MSMSTPLDSPTTSRTMSVSVTYSAYNGLPVEKVFEGLTMDDIIHVFTSLQTRQRVNGGQGRLSTTSVLNDMRIAHYETNEQIVREAVESNLGVFKRFFPAATGRIVDTIMERVGSIRPDWAIELHDTMLRLHRLGNRLRDLQAAPAPEKAVTQA